MGLLMLMHMASIVLMRTFPAMLRVKHTHAVSVGLALMLLGFLTARRGLAAFQRLRERLLAVRSGKSARVEGAYPREVQPLVDDLNALLEVREKAVRRAQETAGDLAHGLKTPLALLEREAALARDNGHAEVAEAISHQVDRMSRQIDYHLARARAAASSRSAGVQCAVVPVVEMLVRTLEKLHAGKGLVIVRNVAVRNVAVRNVAVRVEDFEEILGNLLDNACKWARLHVSITVTPDENMLAFRVEDDGPGLSEPERAAVLERGVRLDEAAPGSGLGLAIVRDLVELYGGSISLDVSEQGGLAACVQLPAAGAELTPEPPPPPRS